MNKVLLEINMYKINYKQLIKNLSIRFVFCNLTSGLKKVSESVKNCYTRMFWNMEKHEK